MIRVLQVTGTMNMGGIENFLMNLYKGINKKKIQFDFLIHQEEAIFEKEIIKLGGKVYKIPSLSKVGYFKYIRLLNKFFEEHPEYKIIHSHYNELNGLILKIAKKNGRYTISHSHTSYPKYRNLIQRIIKIYIKRLVNKNSDLKLACSEIAGKWLYNEADFLIIKNGIITEKYKFNEEKRELLRKKLQCEKDILIGHIGNFRIPKNHKFLLEVFKELLKKDPRYKLALVGDGELRYEIEMYVKKLRLEEKVLFLGIREDVNDLLQAFDLFLFPSIYEGLPVTIIEVQTAGLKTFISNNISKEVDMKCNLLSWLSLDLSSKDWADYIDKNKNYLREDKIDKVRKEGYDSAEIAYLVENLYLNLKNN